MGEQFRVSTHEVRVFQALTRSDGWQTSQQIADASGVAPRTTRLHLQKLVRLGIAEQVEAFPAYLYRLSPDPDDSTGHLDRLTRTAKALGIDLLS